jgi:hypothetical protein
MTHKPLTEREELELRKAAAGLDGFGWLFLLGALLVFGPVIALAIWVYGW